MTRPALLGFIAIVTVGALVIVIATSEPRYNGRTLSSWLGQYSMAAMNQTNTLAEAREAVLAIGPRKALPRLVSLAKLKENPIDDWILDKTDKFRIRFLNWRSPIEFQLEAISGFEILGTNAAPAVPELTRLLKDKERAFVAARCLENIGKPAEAALCECLTNQEGRIRRLSIFALASVTDDVAVYIDRIKPRLKDSEGGIRIAAVDAIGDQINAPDLAIPILIDETRDTDDSVSAHAVDGLAGFGTNAVGAFPTLTNLVNSGKRFTARAAFKALAAIAPSNAVPVLSNAVVNGRAEVAFESLKSLESVAPEMALKMAVEALGSLDRERRMKAIRVASDFDMASPGVAFGLKSAAADADPEIAQLATSTMEGMLHQQREDKNVDAQIPNEPSYQGKSLGEWLRMRNQRRELSTNAVIALREMGTNAIPALLARLAYKDPDFNILRYDISIEAVNAFVFMGDEARPALPALAAMMESDNPDVAFRAMIATLGTGSNAMPVLIRGLTNQYPNVRNDAAHYISEWGKQFPETQKQAVPFLVRLLSDPDEDVRRNATNQVKEIDPKAAAEAGIR